MKGEKSYILTGIIFVSVLGTVLHFAYELSSNNFLVGLFVPINESIWEHTKLIFFPMLLYGLFFNRLQKDRNPNIIYASIILGALVGVLFIIIMFYTYSGIIGYHLAFLDISIFYIAVILSFFVAYKALLSPKIEKWAFVLMILSALICGVYFIFTIFSPSIPLFANYKKQSLFC